MAASSRLINSSIWSLVWFEEVESAYRLLFWNSVHIFHIYVITTPSSSPSFSISCNLHFPIFDLFWSIIFRSCKFSAPDYIYLGLCSSKKTKMSFKNYDLRLTICCEFACCWNFVAFLKVRIVKFNTGMSMVYRIVTYSGVCCHKNCYRGLGL